MNARSYLKESGAVVSVEVDGEPDTPAIEAELRRIYGSSLRLGRWSRRGRKHRAAIEGTAIRQRAFACFEGTP